jgi:dTDP-4-amino-4,6-dideoxygalactose transaminase
MKPRLASYEEIAPFLQRIDQSHIYSNRGPLVRDLEEAYSIYLNTDKELVVALSNATQAIQGLISISKNNNWIVPDYTFSATGLAVLNSNRNLYICDVRVSDWKLDSELISDEKKSFGVIPVMPFGAPVHFEPYIDFDEVIIDAAASLGSVPPSFSRMKKNWAVVYSLHATKVLGAGEGAIVVCGNRTQADLLRNWSNFGFSSNRTSDIQGTNAKMSEVSAAYGLYSILNIEVERADWLKSQEFVALQSKDCDWSTFVNAVPQFHPYWLASFKDEEEKIKVIEKLNDAGIQAREWWAKPLSMQNAFGNSKILSENTNAKWLASVHLGLPMFKGITDDLVADIVNVVKTALRNN